MLRFAQDLKTCRKIAFARVSPGPIGELMSSISPPVPNFRRMPGTMEIRYPGTILVASPPAAVVIIVFETPAQSLPRMSPSRPGGYSKSLKKWSKMAEEQLYLMSLISPEVWVVPATRPHCWAGTRRRERQTRRRSPWTPRVWPVGSLLSTKKYALFDSGC